MRTFGKILSLYQNMQLATIEQNIGKFIKKVNRISNLKNQSPTNNYLFYFT